MNDAPYFKAMDSFCASSLAPLRYTQAGLVLGLFLVEYRLSMLPVFRIPDLAMVAPALDVPVPKDTRRNGCGRGRPVRLGLVIVALREQGKEHVSTPRHPPP